jgi:hypothetical protein
MYFMGKGRDGARDLISVKSMGVCFYWSVQYFGWYTAMILDLNELANHE